MENEERQLTLTQEYEQRALSRFQAWFQETNPTLQDTSDQAYIIVGGVPLFAQSATMGITPDVQT